MARYRVKKGDTLGSLAKSFYGDPGRYPLIVAANSITNPDRLTVGSELTIPELSAAVLPQRGRGLLFVSYSHLDKRWLERFLVFLGPYARQNLLDPWADPYVEVGGLWKREISAALARTESAVFLVSPDFLDSDYIINYEVPPLLKAADEGRVRLFCVPVRSVDVNVTPFAEHQWAWDPSQPLSTLSKPRYEQALVKIVRKIADGSSVPTAKGAAATHETRLDALHPSVVARAEALVELCANQGTRIMITTGIRSWEEQDALYERGRTIPPIGRKYIVTNAKGGLTFHNFGLAFDIVPLDARGKADWDASHPGWRIAGEAGRSVGLEWGGDWKSFHNIAHFQYTGGLSLTECRSLYSRGLAEIWARVS